MLYGPSRTGKTRWARSLGDHVYFGGVFSGEAALAVTEDVKYAVFDDIAGGITFFPRWKDWLGAQDEFMVKALYHDPKLMKWGRPSIWCSNKDPRLEMYDSHKFGEQVFKQGWSQDDVDWIEANCVFINVAEPIFHANTG